MTMHLRRPLALAAGALLLAAPVLSSCGFDYATDRINTNAAGVNNRSQTVDVLGATIVSATPGTGVFIASFSNGSPTTAISFDSLTNPDGVAKAATVVPVELPAQGFANLATVGGIALTGDFTAGDFVTLEVGFSNGQSASLDVPVMTDCHEYAGLASATQTPTADASGTATPSSPSSPDASQVTLSPASPNASESAFSCDYPGVDGDDAEPDGVHVEPADPATPTD